MKLKFNPRNGIYEMVKNQEPEIHLMSQYPAKSGMIKILQNRVNIQSVGNVRYAKDVWYDCHSHTISSDRKMEDAVQFRSYVLPNCGKPAGWIYL